MVALLNRAAGHVLGYLIKERMAWNLDHSYARLPADLFSRQLPTPVADPRVVRYNATLAAALGLADQSEEEMALFLGGNQLPPGADPIAQAYAGHQFGHFTLLGDGRAILLGEQINPQGKRYDVQLKGAGSTPYSRRGDGRATLRAMLREYLISEWMHALGVPTSRSLAVVSTGERVFRDRAQPGAVLCRVMESHIRVGTFEFARNFLDVKEVEALTQHLMQRHFPEVATAERPIQALAEAVMQRQIELISHWMRIGFIHGVMNTDNMALVGTTFDYGPCAFMNAYDPTTVFSSIDSQGRYAFDQQAKIAHWNLAVWMSTLLPLLDPEEAVAVEQAQAILRQFPEHYRSQWRGMMVQKLGFTSASSAALLLVDQLLQWMKAEQADYTNTFLALQGDLFIEDARYDQAAFQQWQKNWRDLLGQAGRSFTEAQQQMRQHNPVYIPRNHQVEAALDEAVLHNDYTLFDKLLAAASTAYEAQEAFNFLQAVPLAVDEGYKTYCGT